MVWTWEWVPDKRKLCIRPSLKHLFCVLCGWCEWRTNLTFLFSFLFSFRFWNRGYYLRHRRLLWELRVKCFNWIRSDDILVKKKSFCQLNQHAFSTTHGTYILRPIWGTSNITLPFFPCVSWTGEHVYNTNVVSENRMSKVYLNRPSLAQKVGTLLTKQTCSTHQCKSQAHHSLFRNDFDDC